MKKLLTYPVWLWHNAQPVYYILAASLLIAGAWRTYKIDADAKQIHTEALQDSTNRLIRQEPHKLRDSLRTDIHNEVMPLAARMDSFQHAQDQTNTHLQVIDGQIRILSEGYGRHAYGKISYQ